LETAAGLVTDSASERIREPPKPPVAPRPRAEVAHEDAEATASSEAGRLWASESLAFNCGQFESARSAFADYSRDSETTKELRTRVNRTNLEEKVMALRALHAKLRDLDAGENFGGMVASARPAASR